MCVKVARTFHALGLNGSDSRLHGHRLGGGADGESERPDRPSLIGRDDNVLLFEPRETTGLNGNGVGTRRRDGLKSEVPAGVGLLRPYDSGGVLVRQGQGGAWHGGTGWVGQNADYSGFRLGEERSGQNGYEGRQQECRKGESLSRAWSPAGALGRRINNLWGG